MIKKYILLAFSLGFLPVLKAQFIESKVLRMPAGKIKQLHESYLTTNSNSSSFNSKSTFLYGLNGLVVEQRIFSTEDTSSIDQKIKYTYSMRRLAVEKADGKEVSINGKSGNSGYQVFYSYDSKGNQISRKYTSDFNNYIERYNYDVRNNLTEHIFYDSNGTTVYSESYKYDVNGNQIEKYFRDNISEGNSGPARYKVDSRGNKIEEKVYFPDGRLRYSMLYKYDIRNNRISEACYTNTGKFLWEKQYEYIYDNYGNWIKLITRNDPFIYTIKREIDYYK